MFLRQNDSSKRTRGLLATLAVAALLPACSDDGAPDTGDDDDDDTGAPLTCAEIDRTMTGEPVDPRLGDQTLSGVYAVEGRVIFDAGQTVTIEPGTMFLMGPDAKLWFGWRNDPATVFADGTAEAPILFCGTDDRKGHWEDLELLTGTTPDSRLAHVRLVTRLSNPSQNPAALEPRLGVAPPRKYSGISSSARLDSRPDGSRIFAKITETGD